jgi:hypothetical protein
MYGRVLPGEPVGTIFLPKRMHVDARKHANVSKKGDYHEY